MPSRNVRSVLEAFIRGMVVLLKKTLAVAFPSPDSSNEVSHTLATRDNPLKACIMTLAERSTTQRDAWSQKQTVEPRHGPPQLISFTAIVSQPHSMTGTRHQACSIPSCLPASPLSVASSPHDLPLTSSALTHLRIDLSRQEGPQPVCFTLQWAKFGFQQ
jgi:hypothetical protein